MESWGRPTTGDAFGAACTAVWDDGPEAASGYVMELWTGEILADDASYYFTMPDQYTPTERWALGHAKGRVVDVGTGVGRYGLDLQSSPDVTDVLGIDTSEACLDIARQRGMTRTITADVHAPLTELGTFDTFLLMGNNLGLLGSPAKAGQVLANLRAVAAPGARIVGTCGAEHLTSPLTREANLERGAPTGQLTMRLRFRELATPWFDYLFASEEELTSLIADTGWEVESTQPWEFGFAAVLRLA